MRAGKATVDAELEKGRQLLQQREYFAALKQYQRVNQLAGGKSADAFLGMALAAQGMKVSKNALDTAQSAIDLAPGNSRLVARAHKVRAEVYAAMGEPPHAVRSVRPRASFREEGSRKHAVRRRRGVAARNTRRSCRSAMFDSGSATATAVRGARSPTRTA